jgi:hypothetical protein
MKKNDKTHFFQLLKIKPIQMYLLVLVKTDISWSLAGVTSQSSVISFRGKGVNVTTVTVIYL